MCIGQLLMRAVVLLLAAMASASAQMYTFDPPGSINTQPLSINRGGTITGYYEDADCFYHGFVRDPQGNFTSFDPPASSIGTWPYNINDSGAITGWYYDGIFYHGFLRDPQGNFTSFDAPGGFNTYPTGINQSGAITGIYDDANYVGHGFVRDPQGNFTTFDAPGSLSTAPWSINQSGAIAGSYEDANYISRGFLRDPLGNITSFDPPGSGYTAPVSINRSGAITGWYEDVNGHGFLRDPQGNFTSFDPPGSLSTGPSSINQSGAITGAWYDGANSHGFLRDPQGNLISFDPPGSIGTAPWSINPSGAVTGNYSDAYAVHGFVGRVPNGVDISQSVGNVSDAAWQSMIPAGVQYAVVQAWGGGTRSPYAEQQLAGDGTTTHGAQGNGLATGACVLLNYFDQDSTAYQVNQAVQAVGTGIGALKFMVVDVTACCGEFVSWQPSHSYSAKAVIMDPASHIQKVVTAGTSGAAAPSWIDTGGTTTDGTVTWTDTGKTVMNQADRVNRISAAVSDIQAIGLKAIVYTDRQNWATITGNCDSGSTNNCSNLISLPLWDVEHKGFFGGDGLEHCGDGIAGIVPFKPYSSLTWQGRSGNQYDFGLVGPAGQAGACNGDAFFGLSNVNMDYFDPTLFQ
jgi:hypothetical protein